MNKTNEVHNVQEKTSIKDISGSGSGLHKFKQLPDLINFRPEIWSGM